MKRQRNRGGEKDFVLNQSIQNKVKGEEGSSFLLREENVPGTHVHGKSEGRKDPRTCRSMCGWVYFVNKTLAKLAIKVKYIKLHG